MKTPTEMKVTKKQYETLEALAYWCHEYAYAKERNDAEGMHKGIGNIVYHEFTAVTSGIPNAITEIYIEDDIIVSVERTNCIHHEMGTATRTHNGKTAKITCVLS